MEKSAFRSPPPLMRLTAQAAKLEWSTREDHSDFAASIAAESTRSLLPTISMVGLQDAGIISIRRE
jgi:hypothetical protein